MKVRLWTRDEVIGAMGLYFTMPFGKMHKGNPRIIEVAGLLGRTPSSLAMKLTNFASLDPAHQKRGVKGMDRRSGLDEQVWEEFQGRWEELAEVSGVRLEQLEGPGVETERSATRAERTIQWYFRKVVLAAYQERCCVTGNPVTALLSASHILPWAEYPAERLNPRNGLCLAAHFDKAFDRGLIGFDADLRLIVGKELRGHRRNDAIEGEFLRRAGQPMLVAERYGPEGEFLAIHRRRFELD
jgi:putative restriction endonuclease